MALPLEGIRILDPSQVWAGPTCTKILGDLGADVIKVESARRMDIARGDARAAPGGMGFYPENDPGPDPWNREGKYADRNRSKRSICLDLTHPRGVDAFKRIAAHCDVVVENYRQGVMDRFGLGYNDLKKVRPDIIMLTMASQGATGPEAAYGSFGVTLEQTAGVASVTGYLGGDPSTSGVLFPDPLVSVVSVGFILAALRQRRQTGEGVYIDLSQREMTTSILGDMVMDYTMNDRAWEPIGNRHRTFAPQGIYQCRGSDVWIAISVETDRDWAAFAQTMGRPELIDDPRYATVIGRREHHDELDSLITAWTSVRDAFITMSTLQAAGVPAGVVEKGEDLVSDPQLVARGFWEYTGHTPAETRPYLSRPFKFSKTPGFTRFPAPLLGADTAAVLRDIAGMSDAEIAELDGLGVTEDDPLTFAP
ncbi:MAG: CoA transferase [Chloroflexi bacterium]|nr:CoA transferase [Chloroflexota bacterium]